MPIQAPSWTDFLFCPICCNEFAVYQRLPISLGCGHTICRQCLSTLHNRQCPFDQTSFTTDVDNLPINNALLQLVSTNNAHINGSSSKNNNSNNNGNGIDDNTTCSEGDSRATYARHTPPSVRQLNSEDLKCYNLSNNCIESLALYLKSLVANNGNFGSPLSRPMQRKLVTLVNTQLIEGEGRERVLRAARSLGERTVTELILQHQNPQQLSSNLWAAVRSRGCQFLGPAMQEEVLKLVLQALEDGTAYSRKVLVMYVVQRLEPRFPQASKTSIGHVVQLLYRASCFKVSKREADSSLMQLKEEFRTYEALRREHDAQIVQIATEAGLRIAPDQWSSLLYGDTVHKSHMQSIIDKLQTPSSFAQSVQELVIALQRTGDPANLSGLRTHLKHLAGIDPSLESPPPSWHDVAKALEAVHEVVVGLVEFVQHHGNRKLQECNTGQTNTNTKYKISLCRDLTVRRNCPRGSSCTFAHSEEELEKYRAKNRKTSKPVSGVGMHSAGMGAINSGAVVNNVKSDFLTPPTHNHCGHNNPHPITYLRPVNDNSAPVSATTSPLRFVGQSSAQPIPRMHNKLPRGSYDDASLSSSSTLPVHGPPAQRHHIPTLHHSPITANSGQTLAVPTNTHRFDTPTFGGNALNYPIPPLALPPRMPQGLANVGNTPLAMRNSSGGVLSPRNFQTTLQQPPTPPHLPLPSLSNLPTTNNPPKYHNNNNNMTSLGSSLSSSTKGIYNVFPPEFYNAGMIGVNVRSPSLFSNNNHNISGVTTGESAAGMNGKNSIELKVNFKPSEKLKQPPHIDDSMWDQQQLIGNTSTVCDLLSGGTKGDSTGISGLSPVHQSSSLYPLNDYVSIFGKKLNNINMDLSKGMNGLGVGESYIFQNDFNVRGNTSTVPPSSGLLTAHLSDNNKGNLGCGDLQTRQSFWHTHNNNIAGGAGNFCANMEERNSIAPTMGGLNSSPGPFRDRDSFVRSDSILDDDAATCEVPATTAGMGNKFGPICPMYKGHNSTAIIEVSPSTNTYLDSWYSSDVKNQSVVNTEHILLDRNVSRRDMNYSVFSSDIENSLALQFHQQLQRSENGQQQQLKLHSQQQHQQQRQLRASAFNNFNSLISDLPFNQISSLIINRESSSTADDSLNVELKLNAFQNMLSGADDNGNIDMNKTSSMWDSSGLKPAETNFWNDSLTSAATKPNELQVQLRCQQQQKQQQQFQQMMRIAASKGRSSSEETTIDNGQMRDIEQELSEIVDKSWSNSDDSGIKL